MRRSRLPPAPARLATALVVLLACDARSPANPGAVPPPPAPSATPRAEAGAADAAPAPVDGGRAPEPSRAIPTDAAPAAEGLETEEREPNPRSAQVRVRIVVTPPVEAVVVWGSKKLGKVGRQPLEIVRPRDSGPMDVEIRAPGYVPFHTRLFTDRDDKIAVHLTRGPGGGTPPPAQAPPARTP